MSFTDRFVVSVALAFAVAACGPSSPDSACSANPCGAGPAPTCSGNTLISSGDATCADDNGQASCSYAMEMTDCTANGKVCAMGACVAPSDPCASATCTMPPANSCDDAVAVSYAQAGTCDSSSGSAVCSYAPTMTDCAALGQVCQDGACFDACASATCDMPPAASCSTNTLTTYASTGTCDGSTGSPVCSYAPTATDCTMQDHVCGASGSSFACVDPCVPDPCDTPPANTCSGFTLHGYGATGTCTSPGGIVACAYTETDVDCSAMNEACSAGACVDPCAGFTCNAPPANACAGTIARTYAAAGTCAATTGVPACTYAETDTDCSLSGQTCNAAACIGPSLFVRVQFPATVVDSAAVPQTIYARVFIQGVTDRSGVDDPTTALVEIGFGTGIDPTAYAYTAMTPNAGYGPGSPGYEANNDEYQGTVTFTAPVGTTQNYAARLSNDGGATWIYGDTGAAGSSDGFTDPGVFSSAGLYFSQYVEGKANASNKALDLYNPTSQATDVSGCTIRLFANGSATSTSSVTIAAATSIAAGGIWELCATGITDASHCSQTTGASLWNGNDAIELVCNATIVDAIGQAGNDPGAAGWGTAPATTTNATLLRDCTVFAGDSAATDAFDPSLQWAGYPADTLTYLGARSCPLP